MADDLTPDDLIVGTQARYQHLEGRPIDNATLHATFLSVAEWTVEHGTANNEPVDGLIDAVRRLAAAAAKINGAATIFCDACGTSYDTDVLEAANTLIVGWQTQNDSNGDPDVTVCGFCIWEHENEPPDVDPADMYPTAEQMADDDANYRGNQEG